MRQPKTDGLSRYIEYVQRPSFPVEEVDRVFREEQTLSIALLFEMTDNICSIVSAFHCSPTNSGSHSVKKQTRLTSSLYENGGEMWILGIKLYTNEEKNLNTSVTSVGRFYRVNRAGFFFWGGGFDESCNIQLERIKCRILCWFIINKKSARATEL